ncbi:MAG: sugar ABC transporter substrate-binding protein [Verrucomicrobia bacterium]|nr:sugar ABC transporter substrate-binding protein [Verrucomicrobiota bacterium]
MKPSFFNIVCAAAWLFWSGQPVHAITLTVLLLSNASTEKPLQRLLDQYSREHPGVNFNVSIVQYGAALTAKINTLLAGGQPPDVLEVTTAYIQTYADQALDLAGYTNGDDLLNRYLPSYQAFIKSGRKVIGIPLEATVNGLFYNEDLFRQAGISVPSDPEHVWTWAQFKDALEKVMKLPTCRIGVAYDCSVQRWSNLLYQSGGRWISPDGNAFLPDLPAAEQALTFFRSLVAARLVPTSSWPGKTDGGQLFKTGVAAMMWTGNWELKTLVEGGTRFPFGTTYFPRNVIRSACPGGEFFIGFARSPYHDEAAKLMLWWAQPSITQRYLESLGGSLLSPMKDVPVNYGKYAAYLKPMIDDLAATPPWVAEDLAKPELNLLQNDLLDQLILYSTGRTPLGTAINNMKNLAAQLLAEDRAHGK